MRISTFNINRFCGAYSHKGYFNPRNIDFRTPIIEIVKNNIKSDNDIFFLQEFTVNKYIDLSALFENYEIHFNGNGIVKSHVVAITLKNSKWKRIEPNSSCECVNKYIEMSLDELKIICFHNTCDFILSKIKKCFYEESHDVILGDFNNEKIDYIGEYRDLVTEDMVTFKPAQTTIDHIFISKNKKEKKMVSTSFDGVTETFASDHNLLTFSLNIENMSEMHD